MAKLSALTTHLKKNFGFDKFKGNQEAIIQNVLDGKDTFVLMPTGGENHCVINCHRWLWKVQPLLFHR